jgi:hypothetical protein
MLPFKVAYTLSFPGIAKKSNPEWYFLLPLLFLLHHPYVPLEGLHFRHNYIL